MIKETFPLKDLDLELWFNNLKDNGVGFKAITSIYFNLFLFGYNSIETENSNFDHSIRLEICEKILNLDPNFLLDNNYLNYINNNLISIKQFLNHCEKNNLNNNIQHFIVFLLEKQQIGLERASSLIQWISGSQYVCINKNIKSYDDAWNFISNNKLDLNDLENKIHKNIIINENTLSELGIDFLSYPAQNKDKNKILTILKQINNELKEKTGINSNLISLDKNIDFHLGIDFTGSGAYFNNKVENNNNSKDISKTEIVTSLKNPFDAIGHEWFHAFQNKYEKLHPEPFQKLIAQIKSFKLNDSEENIQKYTQKYLENLENIYGSNEHPIGALKIIKENLNSKLNTDELIKNKFKNISGEYSLSTSSKNHAAILLTHILILQNFNEFYKNGQSLQLSFAKKFCEIGILINGNCSKEMMRKNKFDFVDSGYFLDEREIFAHSFELTDNKNHISLKFKDTSSIRYAFEQEYEAQQKMFKDFFDYFKPILEKENNNGLTIKDKINNKRIEETKKLKLYKIKLL